MNRKSFIFTSFIVLLNFWIWIILQTNATLGILLIITTLVNFFYLVTLQKKCLPILLVLTSSLMLYQWNLTDRIQLLSLTAPQFHAQNARVVSYPIAEVRIGNYIAHYPLGNLLDGRRETIAFYRIQQNFFESLDLNYYFFATHPRERVGIFEFERFPFVYLPFFISGLLWIKYQQSKLFLTFTLLFPLLLVSVTGSNSTLGIFVLFPFVASTILLSIYQLLTRFLSKIKL